MKKSILDNFSLNKKVAIITGTTKGLGQSLAEALIEAGATVVALDRSENAHMAKFSSSLGKTFKRIKIDLLHATKEDLRQIVHYVIEEFSQIDILVNNAGISRRGEVDDFNENDWIDVVNVNLNVPFYLSQAVAKPFIKQRSGKIINIASMLSYQGGIRVPSYASSKHGIVGLTKSFAVALAQYDINVNAIAPGFMATDLTLPLQQDKERNNLILKRIPACRWGTGEDLKGVLIFLASSMSNYVNGAVIPVDGGWLSA
jgi:2-deoxy-D-gluconate 3-dehydrogenase